MSPQVNLTNAPEIFESIKSGATIDELVRQISLDINDPENVFWV